MPIDPVCRMEVSEGTELKAVYNGKVYYFCSPECKAEFEANPEEYIKGEEMEHEHGHKRHGCCH